MNIEWFICCLTTFVNSLFWYIVNLLTYLQAYSVGLQSHISMYKPCTTIFYSYYNYTAREVFFINLYNWTSFITYETQTDLVLENSLWPKIRNRKNSRIIFVALLVFTFWSIPLLPRSGETVQLIAIAVLVAQYSAPCLQIKELLPSLETDWKDVMFLVLDNFDKWRNIFSL